MSVFCDIFYSLRIYILLITFISHGDQTVNIYLKYINSNETVHLGKRILAVVKRTIQSSQVANPLSHSNPLSYSF